MIYPLVGELAVDGIPVAVTCRVLKIARQPYYRWTLAALLDAGPAARDTHARGDGLVAPARIGPAAPSLDRRGDGDLTPWRDSGNHMKTVDRKAQPRTTAGPTRKRRGSQPGQGSAHGLAGYFSAGLLNRDTKTGRRCITATGLRTVAPALRRVSR
jgi:hypothetical protein